MKNIKEIVATETPQVNTVALGNGTALHMCCFFFDGRLHVALEGRGYYSFSFYAHPSYVSEKLFDNKFYPDAEIVSEWINKQLKQ